MEFYGYEQPLAMLFGSFFNPTSTQMLLQSMQQYGLALREDYYKNQEKLDNFIKEYGLFTSPIEKDEENFYNLTTGGLNDMFNDAEKNGVDLLRSREGRGLILRYIMSRPYGDLAKLKQSAESAKIYNQMAGELASKGLFSEDMAKAIDGDIRNWDTLSGNGIWSKTSPVQYKSIDDMLQSTLEDLRANGYDITDRSKPGIIRHSVSDESIDNALNKDIDDIMAMPQMKYFRDNLGMDNDQFRSYLHKHLRADLADKEEKDDVYFANQSLNMQRAELAIKQRELLMKEDLLNDQLLNNVGFTGRLTANMLNKFDKTYGGTPQKIAQTMAGLSAFYESQAKTLKGKAKERAITKAKWYKEHSNFSGMDATQIAQLLFLDGVIDQYGQLSKRTNERIAEMYSFKANSNNGIMDSDKARALANEYYNNFTVSITNPIEKLGILDVVMGTDKYTYPGLSSKFRQFNFSRKDWKLTDIRRSNIIGNDGNWSSRDFLNWLRKKGLKAYATDTNNTDMAIIPNSNNGRDIDVSFTVSLRREELEDYFNSRGYSEDAKIKFMQDRGFNLYTRDHKVVDGDGKQKWRDIAYVRIPITSTSSNDGYTYSDIDSYMDKLNYGSSKAYDLSQKRQDNSVMN